MKSQFCLRNIPDDLWQWVEEQAFRDRKKISQFIVEQLGEARAGSGRGLPLFDGTEEVADKLNFGSAAMCAFTFIDLFAGIGGFRLGLTKVGGRCVFGSEWDKFARQTYAKWFGDEPNGDINEIEPESIPDHQVLAAGFPCQPFSIAGVSKKRSIGQADGFDCERQGNLFFRICDIVDVKRPPVLILENVKNLRSHDKKRTWAVIRKNIEDRNYVVYDEIIDAADYVPQHRERMFIVCFDRDVFGDDPGFEWPIPPEGAAPKLKSILERRPDAKYILTDHLWNYLQEYAAKHKAKGNGFGFGLANREGVTRTLSARYYKDGSEVLIPRGRGKNPRRLTIVEAARLMGFGEMVQTREDMPVSDTRAYKQFGNAVVPAVVSAVGLEVVRVLARNRANLDNATVGAGRRVG